MLLAPAVMLAREVTVQGSGSEGVDSDDTVIETQPVSAHPIVGSVEASEACSKSIREPGLHRC